VVGALDGTVQQWFVLNYSLTFDATGCSEDCLGGRIINTHGKFVRSKTTENNRVDRTDPGTRKHCDQCFGHHGHIDDDAITLCDAMRIEHASHTRDPFQQGVIGDFGFAVRDRAVVNDCRLRTAPCFNMPVDSVVTGVANAVGEPGGQRCTRVVQYLGWRFDPVDGFRRLGPESLRVFLPFRIDRVVTRQCLRLPMHMQILLGQPQPSANAHPVLQGSERLGVTAARATSCWSNCLSPRVSWS
jgi:hypothetical protein